MEVHRRSLRGHGNGAVGEAVDEVVGHEQVRGQSGAHAVHAHGVQGVRGHRERGERDEPRAHVRHLLLGDLRFSVRAGGFHHGGEQPVVQGEVGGIHGDVRDLERGPDVSLVVSAVSGLPDRGGFVVHVCTPLVPNLFRPHFRHVRRDVRLVVHERHHGFFLHLDVPQKAPAAHRVG